MSSGHPEGNMLTVDIRPNASQAAKHKGKNVLKRGLSTNDTS
jgi:hypothetical protein